VSVTIWGGVFFMPQSWSQAMQTYFTPIFQNSKNVYNLISACYSELLMNPLVGVDFFCDYIEGTPPHSVYAGMSFNDLKNNLSNIMQDISSNENDPVGKEFDQYKNEILEALHCFSVPVGANIEITISICIFNIIKALDAYVQRDIDILSTEDSLHISGPMNSENSRYLVYLRTGKSLLDESYARFRKELDSVDICDFFDSFFLVDKNELPTSKGLPLPPPRILRERPISTCNFSENKLRIAYIPYIGFPTFHFIDNEGNPWDRQSELKGSFTIGYPLEQEEVNKSRTIALLKTAIRNRADIVVFPEFIMSDGMINSIEKYLMERERTPEDCLQFVFAGTTYVKKNEDECNNVLCIINSEGYQLPYTYYKYSPFVDCKAKARRSEGKRPINSEKLTSPGKECVLLDIEGVGRILPSVCKDFIAGEYTSILAYIFKPELILIPSWSKSVNSFRDGMRSFANNIHSSSILCNCCDAVDSIGVDKTAIGAISIPRKIKTKMNAKQQLIYRQTGCRDRCQSQGGCIRIIEIIFDGELRLSDVVSYSPA